MKNSLNRLSELEVSYMPIVPLSERPQIGSSADATALFRVLFKENRLHLKEEAAVIFLNRGNKAVGGYLLSSGGLTGTVVDIRIILGIALKTLACAVILAHNHPSGSLKPSAADIKLTEQLRDAGKIMEIQLLDHIILTGDSYFSFADEELL